MILIESVQYREVEGPSVTVHHFDEFIVLGGNETVGVTTETVVAERYVTADGRRIELGMTVQVRDVIGLPLAACQNQRETIDALYAENRRLRDALNGMTWRQRLGFLFKTGGRIW